MPFELKTQEIPERAPKESDTVANQVDKIARSHPDEVFAYYPKDPFSYADGYDAYTYQDFSNIINGLAHWIINTFGQSPTLETLAYVGPNDIGYNAIILAAGKAGYKIHLPSPRLSLAAHSHLFTTCQPKALITPDSSIAIGTNLAKAGGLKLVTCPAIVELRSKKHDHVSSSKSYQELEKKPMILFHSSGTTGLPKLLPWSYEAVDIYRRGLQLKSGTKRPTESLGAGKKIFATTLPFHAGGVAFGMFVPIFTGSTAVIPVQGTFDTTKLLIDGLRKMPCHGALAAPSMLEEIAANPEMLDMIATDLEFVITGGGPMSQATADIISSRLPCYSQYAGTDIGSSIVLRSPTYDPIEAGHFNFDDRLGYEMRPFDGELYEMVVVRKYDQESLQLVFTIFPDRTEYCNGDLFSRHPTRTNYWRYRGRSDDMIVLLDGSKWNPTSAEQEIEQQPDISAAAIVGTGRKNVALILEVNWQSVGSTTLHDTIIDRVWPMVQKLNQSSPNYAQLTKDKIMISPADKTFPRTAKGTLQRRALADLYANEVDALYQ